MLRTNNCGELRLADEGKEVIKGVGLITVD